MEPLPFPQPSSHSLPTNPEQNTLDLQPPSPDSHCLFALFPWLTILGLLRTRPLSPGIVLWWPPLAAWTELTPLSLSLILWFGHRGSALSDEDKLIRASSYPSLKCLHTCSSVLFPPDMSSCGQEEDFGGNEEITERRNLRSVGAISSFNTSPFPEPEKDLVVYHVVSRNWLFWSIW